MKKMTKKTRQRFKKMIKPKINEKKPEKLNLTERKQKCLKKLRRL